MRPDNKILLRRIRKRGPPDSAMVLGDPPSWDFGPVFLTPLFDCLQVGLRTRMRAVLAGQVSSRGLARQIMIRTLLGRHVQWDQVLQNLAKVEPTQPYLDDVWRSPSGIDRRSLVAANLAEFGRNRPNRLESWATSSEAARNRTGISTQIVGNKSELPISLRSTCAPSRQDLARRLNIAASSPACATLWNNYLRAIQDSTDMYHSMSRISMPRLWLLMQDAQKRGCT